ncbi:MAG TPA: zf-HC2 domain-containing protein [Anaeromyxobacteraceae bacterium]|nr:zf-HC2 domain-containing protein [Anaeromyxobacteraceae bacterium]
MTDRRHITEDEAQLHLEGALPADDSARVDAHVEGCTACQELLGSFVALSEALSSLPVAEPPPDFTRGVMARIEEREAARAAERRITVGVFATVSAALVLALAIAGQSAWAPALSEVSTAAVRALQALRISADVLSPVVSALRLQIIVATAALGIPLFLLLGRLAAPRPARQMA